MPEITSNGISTSTDDHPDFGTMMAVSVKTIRWIW
jgi:hypothetical protein